uniref:Peptidase S1 domain-containing protein n=1 Tax=uncultured Elusimicrobia bacterium TaxID=699876 RepID=A0A650ELD3_9BACT|nr:hypothetical protein Elusimicrob1349_0870 [uncultured Elusimicrobia bacterium]
MNKTLTCAGMLLLLANPLLATPHSSLSDAVNHKVNATIPQNKDAIKHNLRVNFSISEYFYDERLDQDNGPFDADIACKAYALDTNWLILSGTCMRYDQNDIREEGDHEYLDRHDRTVRNISNHAENNNIMLIWTPTPQYKAPFVNVLATTSPAQLFTLSANHTVKINTARYGKDAVRTRKLKTNSIKGNIFKLDEGWTDLSGTATDPLFLISPAGNEFLAGYNNGNISYALQMTLDDILNTYDGQTSDEWFALTKSDLEFIKATVLAKRPKDWSRIKSRLFLDKTDKPYFK